MLIVAIALGARARVYCIHMLTSLRAIGNGLLVAGLLGLLAGFGPLALTNPGGLPAAVFSVYGTAGAPADPFLPGASIGAAQQSDSSETTVAMTEDTGWIILSTIQVTSIYLLLIAAIILIALEVLELKYLRALYRDRTKRGRFSWFAR